MAYFAKIENNMVVDLIVVDNEDCGGGDFPYSEPIGQKFIEDLSRYDSRLKGLWLQTSINTRNGIHYDEYQVPDNGNAFRLNFGQPGCTFDPDAGEYGEFYLPEKWQNN
jgi:hypothetical protein